MHRRCGLCHRLFREIRHGENCPSCGGYGFDARQEAGR